MLLLGNGEVFYLQKKNDWHFSTWPTLYLLGVGGGLRGKGKFQDPPNPTTEDTARILLKMRL